MYKNPVLPEGTVLIKGLANSGNLSAVPAPTQPQLTPQPTPSQPVGGPIPTPSGPIPVGVPVPAPSPTVGGPIPTPPPTAFQPVSFGPATPPVGDPTPSTPPSFNPLTPGSAQPPLPDSEAFNPLMFNPLAAPSAEVAPSSAQNLKHSAFYTYTVDTDTGNGTIVKYHKTPSLNYTSIDPALRFLFRKPSVTIYEDCITEIQDNAFSGSDISSIIIPQSVTSIGKNAFAECQSLTTLSMTPALYNKLVSEHSASSSPEDFLDIAVNCPKLDMITDLDGNILQVLKNNHTLTIYKNVLISATAGNNGECYIPLGVIAIGPNAFNNSISTLGLSDTTRLIVPNSFVGCGNIQRITMNNDAYYSTLRNYMNLLASTGNISPNINICSTDGFTLYPESTTPAPKPLEETVPATATEIEPDYTNLLIKRVNELTNILETQANNLNLVSGNVIFIELLTLLTTLQVLMCNKGNSSWITGTLSTLSKTWIEFLCGKITHAQFLRALSDVFVTLTSNGVTPGSLTLSTI